MAPSGSLSSGKYNNFHANTVTAKIKYLEGVSFPRQKWGIGNANSQVRMNIF
jgi:hypothetical protein